MAPAHHRGRRPAVGRGSLAEGNRGSLSPDLRQGLDFKFERLDLAFFQAIRGREPAAVHFILQYDARAPVPKGQFHVLVFCLGDRVIKQVHRDRLHRRADPDFPLFPALRGGARLRLRFAAPGELPERPDRLPGPSSILAIGSMPLTNFVRHRNPVLHALFRAIKAGRGSRGRSLDQDLANHLTGPSPGRPRRRRRQRARPEAQ